MFKKKIADTVFFVQHSLKLYAEFLSPLASTTLDCFLTSFGFHACQKSVAFVHFSLVAFTKHFFGSFKRLS